MLFVLTHPLVLFVFLHFVTEVNAWRLGNIANVIQTRVALKSTVFKRAHKLKLQFSVANRIVSPFDKSEAVNQKEADSADDKEASVEVLPLTMANVELVLDEVRPHLQADGGDVVLQGITSDNVVRVTLVGACGSCPMSTVTMKMGLERTLMQRIPSITAVEQVAAPLPVLNTEKLEELLQGVRPLVTLAGGTVSVLKCSPSLEPEPSIILHMEGAAAALQSVKIDIVARIQKQFGTAVYVEWTV